MSELRFQELTHGELARLSLTFNSGSHVVLGTEADGTNTLLMLAAGLLAPARGLVTLDGSAPRSHAATRRQIAGVCARETLPPGRDVQSALTLALAARSETRSGLSVLDAAGLASFALRRLSDLTAQEARAVALALALSHPEPRLLALHEPLGLVGLVSEEFLLGALRRFAAAGAIVLCSATGVDDAARLGGSIGLLDRGFWLDSSQTRATVATITLRVQSPEPRRLAARLAEAPAVDAVEWSGTHELLVRGSNLERLAHSIVANARAEAIRITALKQDPPNLELLAATRAALSQSAYEQARSVAAARQP